MRSSAVVALALLAAASPALSAPTSHYARHYPNTARRSEKPALSDIESAAFRLPAGAGGNILSLFASAGSVLSDLWPSGNKREFEAILSRAIQNEIAARDLSGLESGAFRLPPGAGGNILSLFASGGSLLSDLLPKGNKRELESLLARANNLDDESGAFLGAAANIGTLLSSGVSIFQNLFGGNKKQAREFVELMARAYQDEDESGAFLGAAANIGALASSAVSIFQNLFGGNKKQAREFVELMTRAYQDDEESGAFLAAAANIGTLASSAVSIFQNLFGGNKREAREFIELMTRAYQDEDESGAFLGAAANIGTLASSAVSIFQNLFGGNKREAREFVELMTRAYEDSLVSRSLYDLD